MKKSILAFVIAQILAVVFMFFSAYEPIYRGKEYKFEVKGVDPRDIFLGNFVTFRYIINDNFYNEINNQMRLNSTFGKSQNAYISFKKLKNGLYKFDKISLQKPEQDFIVVKYNGYEILSVISKLYLEKNDALELENMLREKSGIAKIMIMENGKARLIGVEFEDFCLGCKLKIF